MLWKCCIIFTTIYMILFCYFDQLYVNNWASQVAQWLRIHLQCKRALGQEDPLEKEMATHSSILA